MSKLKLWLVLILVSIAADAPALERRYLASMDDSSWTLTDSSAVLCRLEHVIPRFGWAVFSRQAGRGLQFELISRQRFKAGLNVELRSESASWNSRRKRAVLARFETSGGQQSFRVPAAVAEQTYFELRQGRQPGFLFYDTRPLFASLSTVQFGVAERAFSRCVAALYHDNFEDVRISNILFSPDDEFASLAQEEHAFTRMLDYLEIDDAIAEIVINGHADVTGTVCYNDGLSERRAWYVYDLLLSRGISSELLRVDYFGERQPLIKGTKSSALAVNRRVSVELRR